MNTISAEVGHRPFNDEQLQSGESRSSFLTDREGAELTAVAFMGPLAVVAFDTEPQLGVRPAPEYHNPAERPAEVPDTVDGFTSVELLEVARRQRNLAGAAIMFAESRLN